MNATHLAKAARADYPRLTNLAWGHFLNDGSANYLPGILPAILISLNVSVSYAGLFMAALVIGQALQPVTGLIADKVGGRTFIVAGVLGTTVGGALIGLMPNQWSLVALLIATGLCNSLFHPQALAAVRMIGGHRNGSSMGIFLIGGEIGRGAWPLIVSWLVATHGLEFLWVLVIPGLLTLPVLWRYAPALPPRSSDAAPLRLKAHAGPLSCLVGYCALRSIMIYAPITFLPILWHVHGGGLVGGAGFVAVILLCGIVGNLGGGHIGDYIAHRTIVITASVATVVLMIAFMLTGGWIAWVLLALFGVALFSTVSLTVLIGQDILPENRSLGSGIALGLANGLGALGMIALGPIADAWGAATAIWVAVGCGVVAVGLAIALPKSSEQAS